MGKRIGLTGLIVGLVLATYGWSQIKTYTEEKFDQSKSRPGMFGGRDDMTNYFELQNRNEARLVQARVSVQRNQPYIVYGGAIALAGALLLIFSLVQRRPPSPSATQAVPESVLTSEPISQAPAVVAAVPEDWRCPRCGAPHVQTENSENIVCQNMHMTPRR